jgi:hypothetical protein
MDGVVGSYKDGYWNDDGDGALEFRELPEPLLMYADERIERVDEEADA